MLTCEPHPLLDLRAFVSVFPVALEEMATPDNLISLLSLTASAPLVSSDLIRKEVRNLLRTKKFKPTGRNKPASEYLIKAIEEGLLSSINPAVDACNVVSLHSGLPISVVDLDLATPPLNVAVCTEAQQYAFNATGQLLNLNGLLCLNDTNGPCASAIKDSHRTKVTPSTTRTLSLIWGTIALPGLVDKTTQWYREVISGMGGETELLTWSA